MLWPMIFSVPISVFIVHIIVYYIEAWMHECALYDVKMTYKKFKSVYHLAPQKYDILDMYDSHFPSIQYDRGTIENRRVLLYFPNVFDAIRARHLMKKSHVKIVRDMGNEHNREMLKNYIESVKCDLEKYDEEFKKFAEKEAFPE